MAGDRDGGGGACHPLLLHLRHLLHFSACPWHDSLHCKVSVQASTSSESCFTISDVAIFSLFCCSLRSAFFEDVKVCKLQKTYYDCTNHGMFNVIKDFTFQTISCYHMIVDTESTKVAPAIDF